MKHRLVFYLKLLPALAVTAAFGLVASSASASGHATAKPASASSCSLNPAPPVGFVEKKVTINGVGINYVRGGHGPALLLIHGYPESWYEWDDILPALAAHYTVVAPDLPGAGNSDAPAVQADYTKKAMAADLYALMGKLGLRHNIRIVGHDIGTMVAYSYAAAHPADVTKLVVSEAPLPDPSIYTYPALTAKGPGLWWFGLFNDPGNLGEKMFAGKEKQWVYGSMPILEVVKNSLTQCDLALWTHDLEKPGHLQATIDWFSTFSQDIKNDAIYQKTPLTMPVLAIGSAYVLGANVADQFRHYATHVTKLVIPDAGHWLFEEQPAEMTSDLLKFVG